MNKIKDSDAFLFEFFAVQAHWKSSLAVIAIELIFHKTNKEVSGAEFLAALVRIFRQSPWGF
jgi:hypothetical protein